ncbi:threonine synthase [Dehalobacter sp. DCM]|uniref:threonine synthase n=1 Tax=Dehalobacter sp. DCM TaxID=2907827 RepID=UPI003081D439|nr:threonine synthase [Dehalobacter sp. DCM]
MFISTRGNIEPQTSAQAIALGMVPQGGLFVPCEVPTVDWRQYIDSDYAALALAIMKSYCGDLPEGTLEQAVKAYHDGRFDTDNPAPLVMVGNCGLLELWHGPTAAFKDMALQILPYLLTASTKELGEDKEVLILTATSGDTGKAALEGFKDVAGTKIVVFYPDGGVSPVQEKQMLTTGGNNTYVAAVKGNFDECQTAVKHIFASEELRQKLSENQKVFSSANSINWGRLLPQIVYYYWSYLEAVRQRVVAPDAKINIVVPTGNFGNILAAFYAQKMGLPIANLICASNKNKVLTDFFEDGIYEINRPFYLTTSPSMDILISSNFERYLFEISGRDSKQITQWFNDLSTTGKFQVDADTLNNCRNNMTAGWADEAEVLATIRKVYNEYQYLLDPHTAVGMKVYEDYKNSNGDNTFTVIASTASPFKFAKSVLAAVTDDQDEHDPWAALIKLSTLTGWKIPDALEGLREKPTMDVYRCKPDEIAPYLMHMFIEG